MHARNCLGCLLVVAATFLLVPALLASARDPLVLPAVTEVIPAPYDAVWDAALRSLGSVKPFVVDKSKGFMETDPFFYYFPAGGEASQSILVKLAITLSRPDAQHTAVQVQPLVQFMIYEGVLPGPTNNPWSDFLVRLRGNLGPGL